MKAPKAETWLYGCLTGAHAGTQRFPKARQPPSPATSRRRSTPYCSRRVETCGDVDGFAPVVHLRWSEAHDVYSFPRLGQRADPLSAWPPTALASLSALGTAIFQPVGYVACADDRRETCTSRGRSEHHAGPRASKLEHGQAAALLAGRQRRREEKCTELGRPAQPSSAR